MRIDLGSSYRGSDFREAFIKKKNNGIWRFETIRCDGLDREGIKLISTKAFSNVKRYNFQLIKSFKATIIIYFIIQLYMSYHVFFPLLHFCCIRLGIKIKIGYGYDGYGYGKRYLYLKGKSSFTYMAYNKLDY